MEHILKPESGKTLEQSYAGTSYTNAKGNAECVEFIQQTLKAPQTKFWIEGRKVTKDGPVLPVGTAIATFVDGKYPQTGRPASTRRSTSVRMPPGFRSSINGARKGRSGVVQFAGHRRNRD